MMSEAKVYFTPEAALEVVRAEIAADSPRPLDAILANPPLRLCVEKPKTTQGGTKR